MWFQYFLVLFLAPLVASCDSVGAADPMIRGVNLGGWLVLEPWITPSIFETAGGSAVDEYTLSRALGPHASRLISGHWDRFITRDDFSRIRRAGFTHLRIPIGYWAVSPIPGEPFVSGQLERLDSAIEWAREIGLKIMIDLHGAPGSQNGLDNSGRLGVAKWQKRKNVKHTLKVLGRLSMRYASSADVVSHIELLNEPLINSGAQLGRLKRYYWDAAWDINYISPGANVTFSDANLGPVRWNNFDLGVIGVLDTHHYQVFDNNMVALSTSEHIEAACIFGLGTRKSTQSLVIGEWAGAMNDCAKYLNGRHQGARYDGTHKDSNPKTAVPGGCVGKTTGSISTFPDSDKINMRRFIEAQIIAYENGSGRSRRRCSKGWFWWTWKTEQGAPGWDMTDLLAHGILPQPLDKLKHGFPCDKEHDVQFKDQT